MNCRNWFLIGLLPLSLPVTGQTCVHAGLSKLLVFTTSIHRLPQGSEFLDSCFISVKIAGKTHRLTQVISYSTSRLYKEDYQDCRTVWHYKPRRRLVIKHKVSLGSTRGNDYLIVADLNFDGREDFAILTDSQDNGQPAYRFYLQNTNESFVLDPFLTEEVRGFPEKISMRDHTLTTLAVRGDGVFAKTTYTLAATGEWVATGVELISY